MRGRSLGLAGLLFAAAVMINACSEPKVASHIESVGAPVVDSLAAGATRTLTARVTDQNHHGMEGVEVIWRVVSGSGTISSTQTSTSGDGTTSVIFTAPATQGELTSVASGIAILGSASSFTIIVK
jgi:hypothetical protein